MFKMTLITIFLFSTLQVFAPEQKALYIDAGSVINYYDPLIRAVVMVESAGGKYLYNAKENAIGPFQLRAIRVKDYNQRTKSNYQHEDFYNYELSRKVFLFYAHGKTYEQAAKSWNGFGKKNEIYWCKIKNYLK